MITVTADPFPFTFDPDHVALLCIDFQRDFMEAGGFGESLGNDVSRLRTTIEPTKRVLDLFRSQGWPVIHTREATAPTSPTSSRASATGATRACASARRDPWAGSWSAARRATASCPSSRPSRARSCSTSRARARSTRRTWRRSCGRAASRTSSSPA